MFSRFKEGVSSFIEKVSMKSLSEDDLRRAVEELKFKLVENDVALPIAEFITDQVKRELLGRHVSRFKDIGEVVKEALRSSLLAVLNSGGEVDLTKLADEARRDGRPLTLVFVGVNGTGKTTTIAKVAKLFLNKGYSVALACSDTFRAGAQEQLEIHAKRLGVFMVKHRYGADPAAVAYDALNFAKARGLNVVLIDTAGRMYTDRGLMEELKKIKRVIKPDLIIFIGDSLTGYDALNQAEAFNKYVGIGASILTKVDADAKGGCALSIIHSSKKPVIYLGVGQGYEDLIKFNPEWLVNKILPP